jgi:hypothetical protein
MAPSCPDDNLRLFKRARLKSFPPQIIYSVFAGLVITAGGGKILLMQTTPKYLDLVSIYL